MASACSFPAALAELDTLVRMLGKQITACLRVLFAAIQVARSLGAQVIASASREHSIAACRELKADHIINHKTSVTSEEVRNLLLLSFHAIMANANRC